MQDYNKAEFVVESVEADSFFKKFCFPSGVPKLSVKVRLRFNLLYRPYSFVVVYNRPIIHSSNFCKISTAIEDINEPLESLDCSRGISVVSASQAFHHIPINHTVKTKTVGLFVGQDETNYLWQKRIKVEPDLWGNLISEFSKRLQSSRSMHEREL